MADRIVVLSEGRILQTGAPREIYERPASPVVALQLGQPAINLLPVRREGGQWRAADGTPLMRAEASGAGRAPARRAPRERGPAGRRGGIGSGGAHRRAHGADDHVAGRLARVARSHRGAAPRNGAPGRSRASPHRCRARRAFRRDADSTKPGHREGGPMTARSFEPKFMKMSVLTAALQELTPRRIRDEDPDRAIEDWLRVRPRARLPEHPALGRPAPDARPTCRPRRCSTRSRTRSICASRSTRRAAKRVLAAMQATGVGAHRHRASSTTCSTTTTICARRSTSSWCA